MRCKEYAIYVISQKMMQKKYLLPFSEEYMAQCCGKEIQRFYLKEYVPTKKDVCSECAEEIFKFIKNKGEADE